MRICHNQGHHTTWEQEKHQLKLRKPLQEVVDFDIADWMFPCESPPPFSALFSTDFGGLLRAADALAACSDAGTFRLMFNTSAGDCDLFSDTTKLCVKPAEAAAVAVLAGTSLRCMSL